jgi:hypothetical protein
MQFVTKTHDASGLMSIPPIPARRTTYLSLVALVSACAILPCPAQQNAVVQTPLFPRNFVGHPEFQTKQGNQSAGTAFLAKLENAPGVYLLTVRHLLGPKGHFPTQISAAELPSFVRAVRLEQLFGGGSRLYQVQGLHVPETSDERNPLFELAAFKTTMAAPGDIATLTSATPAVGDPVWVLAHVKGGVPSGELIHTARVVEGRRDWLTAEFNNPNIITAGASGAPVINAAGKVVGIYQGHIAKDGKMYAAMIPSRLVIEVIKQPASL